MLVPVTARFCERDRPSGGRHCVEWASTVARRRPTVSKRWSSARGFVAVERGDDGSRVVGHDELRHTAVEMERTHHAGDPVVQALVRRGAGEDVARRGHGRDEDPRRAAFPQRHDGAGEVDEKLFPARRCMRIERLSVPVKAL